jgi:glycosyltransferase involved in cell wall biosynthesis
MDSRIKLVKIDRKRLGYPPTPENHWLVGPVRPINAGLRYASGDWIARIDDDDEWTPEHLESSLKIAISSKVEFVSSSYIVVEKEVISRIDPTDFPPIGGVQTWVYRSYLRFFKSHLSCWRKTWNRVNDTDVAQRMRNAGVRVGVNNNIGATISPRRKDEPIGSKAYLLDPDYYSSFYKTE